MLLCSILLYAALQLVASTQADETPCKADPKEIVDFHNHLRRNVVPPAAGMLAMGWSDELANLAQRAANSCRFEHNYGGDFKGKGENLYRGGRCNFTEIIMLFFIERDNYDYETNTCKTGKDAKYQMFSTCGHYLQVVSADVLRVGCGIAKCDGVYLAACEYDKMKQSPPYKRGLPGTKCDYRSAGFEYNKLCYSKHPTMPQPPSGAESNCKLQCENGATLRHYSWLCQCRSCPNVYYGSRCEKYIFLGTPPIRDCAAQAVTCDHGGVPTMQGRKCICKCPEPFGGYRCQHDMKILNNSVSWYFGQKMRYRSYYPVQASIMEDLFITELLQYDLTYFINEVCNENFSICCPEQIGSSLSGDFVTTDGYKVPAHFPAGVLDGSLRVPVYFTMSYEYKGKCNKAISPLVNRATILAAANKALTSLRQFLKLMDVSIPRID